MTVMPRTTVAEVLECLEDEFATFAQSFCRGDYLLWLGSGISREVVPSVPGLLEQMLEFLRVSIDAADSNCRFRRALEDVLDVANLPEPIRSAIDVTAPVETWGARDDIISRLVDRYADVLSVQVRDEPDDFLVWTGLDATSTYGAPGLQPDVEHYCVAVLMLEGVVQSAPTANWDGLVESAMTSLVGDAGRVLRVVVIADDFRNPERQADLVKFHGCVVRASVDEAGYRSRLIARKAQISGWTTRPENQMLKNHLEHLFASRPAFIVGLSAQDPDIHTVLQQATQNLSREWPVSPPAVVFAEQSLHHHHRHVLQVTYGASYPANTDAIAESALLGAFARPALVALVLFALADKLCVLVGCVAELALTEDELERVRADVRDLRDFVGASADADPRALLEAIVSAMGLALPVFRKGVAPDPANVLYQQISEAPVAKALENPDFPGATLGRFAVVVSLLGRGLAEGRWHLALGTPAHPNEGVVRIANARQTARLFVVSEQRSLAQLVVDGVVDLDDDDAIVIQAEAVEPPSVRAPRTRYGRTGTAGARWIDFERLCANVNSADELFEAFRLEGVL